MIRSGHTLAFTAKHLLLVVSLAIITGSTNAQSADTGLLYKSALFTPVNSFTIGVEGPAVDKEGNVYAVNFDHDGSIGKMTPDGSATVFIELPKRSTGNGIRFDSHGNMLIADYMGHNIIKVNMATKQQTVLTHEQQ